MAEPIEDKTAWRLSSEVNTAEGAGKVLHPCLQQLCEDFLQRHRPVIRRNLGPKARFDITFTDETHGEGAGLCFTLFPGFWDDSQTSRFHSQCLKRVLGAGEQVVRNILSKALSNALSNSSSKVRESAVHQTLHRSKEVHDRVYLRGNANAANPLQAQVLGW